MRTFRIPAQARRMAVGLAVALAAAAWAATPEQVLADVREGLLSPGRRARERAEAAARELARTDPMGVLSLWDDIDLQGRCLLLRALAGAGTRHAAEVALARSAAPEPELFRALLDGLAAGGEASLFAPLPADLSPARQEAIEELRLRWRLEAELARLKSPSGPTGHYEGQYERVKALGPGVVPILFDITTDRARPLPGESASGPYASIHPDMARFETRELRQMAAYAFGEVVDPSDRATVQRLVALQKRYRGLEGEEHRFEREDLAADLAFSLFDLGVKGPAQSYIRDLERRAHGADYRERMEARWNLGYACIRVGRYEEGQAWYEKVLEESEGRAIAAYNLACNFSVRAEREPDQRDRFRRLALHYLERAIREFNYGDWKWMEEDGDLRFIRKEPKYQELLRHLQARYPDRPKGKVSKERGSFLK